MSTLPYECIAHIIEQIDEPQALFNLLTINKVVFPLAARHLYRDPIRYLRNKTIMPLVLFRRLLLLSSVNDSATQDLRQALRAPLRKECDPPLMLDYLNHRHSHILKPTDPRQFRVGPWTVNFCASTMRNISLVTINYGAFDYAILTSQPFRSCNDAEH
ncbi:hypothetical protein BGZ73_006989 [Actinomortierella ambigua]|nr:hypothetical protein BGZ73_006989 [Actinomortierella ambigua]